MTRVLQVIDGLRVGGAETMLLGLLELADDKRTAMYVASVGPSHPELVERVRANSRGLYLVESRGLWDPRTLISLIAIIRRERIDLVQTHLAGGDFQGGLAARLTGRPAVAVLHSVARDRGSYGRVRGILANLATRRFADRIIAVSEVVKKSHIDRLGIPAERFVVIPNIPVAALLLDERFDRDKKRRELGVSDSPLLTTASRLDRPKDQQTLLAALPLVLAAHPDLTVLVIGDGPMREELERLTRELGVEASVTFAGVRLDAVELIAASDVFCHPTLYEGFGLAVAEAMTLGVPVVASRVAGVVELVADGRTGILVPPENPVALAEALTGLLGDAERRRRLGAGGRQAVVARFDSGAWLRQVEAIYDELLQQRRGWLRRLGSANRRAL
jgi:glycosyltransferase involved in cell wall biosynthesis